MLWFRFTVLRDDGGCAEVLVAALLLLDVAVDQIDTVLFGCGLHLEITYDVIDITS